MTILFSLFSPDRAMVEDTNAVAEMQHQLSCTLQNYLMSDQFPAMRPRISFHVSYQNHIARCHARLGVDR